MSGWRAPALVALVSITGAAATLLVGSLTGMGSSDLVHLGALLLPAIAATVVASAAARPLLRGATARTRLIVIAAVASAISLANLAVLAGLMFVSSHDALQVAVLLAYSLAAGLGAALALARSFDAGIRRLVATAHRLAEGDLEARAGSIDAGAELEMLARTLDDTAQRLSAALANERAAEAMRSDLLRAVSHDLRTPLAGLRAMLEAIDDGVVDDSATLRQYVARMRVSVQALGRLIDDLFELVQLDAETIASDGTRVPLSEVIEAAVAACEAQATAKGVAVSSELNGAGDAACSPRIVRVVQNLLQNAIGSIRDGGSVRIVATRAKPGLRIVVEDTGRGIAHSDLDRIFEPFWRADSSRSTEGSGLGLALAKRIVETHGGSIDVESAVDQGSRFTVVLPNS